MPFFERTRPTSPWRQDRPTPAPEYVPDYPTREDTRPLYEPPPDWLRSPERSVREGPEHDQRRLYGSYSDWSWSPERSVRQGVFDDAVRAIAGEGALQRPFENGYDNYDPRLDWVGPELPTNDYELDRWSAHRPPPVGRVYGQYNEPPREPLYKLWRDSRPYVRYRRRLSGEWEG